jgi:phage shock protein A
LLAQARDEQRALVWHCEQARDEVARWEEVARHELTQGREKTAKRALARRNQWARSFSHQLMEAEKQHAALAAHDELLQAVAADFERQAASV